MEFPLTFGLQKTGLPLILTSGKINNLCFLIDTGATHNTLFYFVCCRFVQSAILFSFLKCSITAR